MAKTLGSRQHEALISLLVAKREEAGLTQAELAKAFGQYQSFIARLESGQRRVDVVELIQLAKLLKFDICKLIRLVERTQS